jgi:hypothetical protein
VVKNDARAHAPRQIGAWTQGWAYIVERSGGLLVGSTADGVLDPATGNRASPLGSAHPAVRASAVKLEAAGWPIGYKYVDNPVVPSYTFVTAAIYDTADAVATGETYGLDWLLVAGQDVLCDQGEIWLASLTECRQCKDGEQPDPNPLAVPP